MPAMTLLRSTTIALAIACLFVLSACSSIRSLTLHSAENDKEVKLKVEVAISPAEKEAGLMNRDALGADNGMLFVFPNAQPLTFWMKNTKIPLDIIFFDGAGRFVNSITMQPCVQDPCPQYKSAEPSQFALEVNKGFKSTHGIGVGWYLDPDDLGKIGLTR